MPLVTMSKSNHIIVQRSLGSQRDRLMQTYYVSPSRINSDYKCKSMLTAELIFRKLGKHYTSHPGKWGPRRKLFPHHGAHCGGIAQD